jgi:hypothetical protein
MTHLKKRERPAQITYTTVEKETAEMVTAYLADNRHEFPDRVTYLEVECDRSRIIRHFLLAESKYKCVECAMNLGDSAKNFSQHI